MMAKQLHVVLPRRSLVQGGVGLMGFELLGCSTGHRSGAKRATGGAREPSTQPSGTIVQSFRTAVGPISLSCSRAEYSFWREVVVAASRDVVQVWGATSQRIRITVVPDERAFARFQSVPDASTAAVTNADGIWVSPRLREALQPRGCQMVLAHELTHSVLGQYGANRVAMWVKEGSAEWTAERRVPLAPHQLWRRINEKELPQKPPSPGAFTGSEEAAAYECATAYVTYLAAHSDSSRFISFIRSNPSEGVALNRAAALVGPSAPSFSGWLRETLKSGSFPRDNFPRG